MIGKIHITGIGPGDNQYLLPITATSIQNADVLIGYQYYFQFIENHINQNCKRIERNLKEERLRAKEAISYANDGNNVTVISSGDAGIYAMAAIVFEEMARSEKDVEIKVIPGISAFQLAASRLGAPIGHDFCTLSLSNLLTPWETIQNRITAAAKGDFITAVYNPKSKKRDWQLQALKDEFLQVRSSETPVAICKQLGRKNEETHICRLNELDISKVDMFSIVMIGNSQTFISGNKMITPRGYYNNEITESDK
ncbi:MAG: precorrin-3B C(17)-methyltransferase, partial [Flavobacteriales bacterium]